MPFVDPTEFEAVGFGNGPPLLHNRAMLHCGKDGEKHQPVINLPRASFFDVLILHLSQNIRDRDIGFGIGGRRRK
jgi:hypothetical protein